MKKLTALLTILWAALGVVAQQYYPVRDRLEVTNLDGTWQFQLQGDADWRTIQVPGNWETQGVKAPEYGRRLSPMTGTYRRTFNFQDDWRGRDVVLRLDGVQHGFTAYVNGQEVGSGHSGHTMHQFCVTPYLKEGQNEIRIDVTTHSDFWLFDVCDAWSLTGIKRSVELFSVPKEGSLADVIFTSKVNADNSADITVQIKTNGTKAARATVSLLDERYNHVADMQATPSAEAARPLDACKASFFSLFTLHSSLKSPRLWTAETPNLYRLNVKLFDAEGRKLQAIEEKVGIREVRVEGCKILLNNREIFLRGACLSENDAIEGGAMTPLHRRQQLEQMKAANINFIRTAHYPLDPVVMRLCDEMGFYVCEEIPFAARGDEYLKTNSPEVVAELKARAKATIDRDRNCPSIIMWSHGNENKIYKCQDSVLCFTKEYDPTRLRGVPQAKGSFLSYIKRPSKYVDVICGHYANDGVLKEACEKSELPIINTEYAHAVGTSFGDLEHKYDIFRREPKIAGGSVWCFQDQSILTRNFNQQHQVLKGVRIDSVRYMDCWGMNPIPDGEWERNKEGTDGVVYGDGYPQEDYFELAQVYTPVFISEEGRVNSEKILAMQASKGRAATAVENRFDFISLHGYSLRWQLKQWQQVLDEGTIWLSAKAHEKETITIPLDNALSSPQGGTGGRLLCMQVLRPDGSLCYEKSIKLNDNTDYRQMLSDAKGSASMQLQQLKKQGFLLRVGRPVSVNTDYRRDRYWQPYLLEPVNVKTKKQKGGYHITCRWQGEKAKNYIDGDIAVTTAKDGTTTIDYTLTPSDSIGGHMLDFGLAFALPKEYDQVAWLGQGPFSQTPDKTAYNNYGVWQLHKDDIRFDGNRAEVDLMAFMVSGSKFQVSGEKMVSPTNLTVCSENKNLHIENIDGQIVLTDNLVVGTYGTKFTPPAGINANKLGQRKGRIVVKAALMEDIFGPRHDVNPEQPYMQSYGR